LIPIEYYTSFYFLLLSLVTILSILPLFTEKTLKDFPSINLISGTILICCITIAFIGLRDPFGNWRYLGDTSYYTIIFEDLNESSYGIKKDVGFYILMYISKQFLNIQMFYLLCATIYVLPVYFSFKKWFKQYAFFALLMFVTSMSFWSFGINGLRNGLATSIFIFGLSFQNNKVKQYGLMFLALTFHNSMILPLIAYLISNYFTNTKVLIKIWLVTIIISFFWGSQIETFIGDLAQSLIISDDKRIGTYFSDEIEGEIADKRFRLDFILYSSIVIILGYYYKYKLQFQSIFYDKILNIYIIANTVWVLLIYLAYTNRTAYLSWFIMPIVMIYPLLKENFKINETKFIAFLIIGSLVFTLFMQFK
jgi:hypothetical protein